MKSSKLWDCECEKCNHIFEAWLTDRVAPCCPSCQSAFTRVLPGGSRSEKAKDPYDYLTSIPDDKRVIVSVPKNYRSK